MKQFLIININPGEKEKDSHSLPRHFSGNAQIKKCDIFYAHIRR
ncbi:MAG: hypothetical protein U9R19_10590 [Bacteroidota bacterium]|nr:hypothetical protein [Bacteroidota bacterium]